MTDFIVKSTIVWGKHSWNVDMDTSYFKLIPLIIIGAENINAFLDL